MSIMARLARTPRWVWALGVGCFLALGIGAFFIAQQNSTPTDGPEDRGPALSTATPPTPLSATAFRNVVDGVAYIGTRTCAECHPAEFDSYQRTHHSRSLAEADPMAAVGVPAEFIHRPSGRTYRVYREDGQLWHQESIDTKTGEELILSAHPMRYAFGSGTHTQSYVAEIDGFLIESPITWYPAKQGWGMSPGYDRPDHWAFERIASYRCFLCHASQVEMAAETPNRLTIHAAAIGCERCHGPGELHAAAQRLGSGTAALAGDGHSDPTIVHPGRLSRDQKEAICAQCHVGHAAAVDLRGHGIGAFRPGRALTDFRIDYDFAEPVEGMTVVGHFRQMRQSRCYQASDTLTCTTCHNPHAKPRQDERIAYYRTKCLACHDDANAGCAQPAKVRLAKSPEDDCAACHMPAAPTSVPHTAFTHHRIGLHGEQAERSPPSNGPGDLVPMGDISHLPKVERDRCLGLAYLQVSGEPQFAEHAAVYRSRAQEMLEDVCRRGLEDPKVEAALATLYWRKRPERAVSLAEATLAYESVPPEARLDALFVLGTSHFDAAIPAGAPFDVLFRLPPYRFHQDRLAKAREALEELTQARRDAEDWLLLSVCRRVAGDEQGALDAVRKATDISPGNPQIHAIVASVCARAGQSAAAAEHRRFTRLLSDRPR